MKVWVVMERDDWPMAVYSNRRAAEAHAEAMRKIEAEVWPGERTVDTPILEYELQEDLDLDKSYDDIATRGGVSTVPLREVLCEGRPAR
jgi:hypothetical protein